MREAGEQRSAGIDGPGGEVAADRLDAGSAPVSISREGSDDGSLDSGDGSEVEGGPGNGRDDAVEMTADEAEGPGASSSVGRDGARDVFEKFVR